MIENFSFAYPWALVIVPFMFILTLSRRPSPYSAIPTAHSKLYGSGSSLSYFLLRTFQPFLIFLFLAALTIASARPQTSRRIDLGAESRRNIMVAMDVSRSMDANDFLGDSGYVRRITGVKQVTRSFIERRSGDRIGLVLFGSRAFLQAPLTIDHRLLSQLVESVRLGVAGDGTALGDGLGISLKRVKELRADTRAVILITDGVSNSGRVDPLKAAGVAKELGVKVYAIGIGSEDGGYIDVGGGLFGSQRVRAEFDEATLRDIANTTGGKYYFAADVKSLSRIYDEIDALETTEQDERSFFKVQEHAEPFVLLALLTFLLHFVLSQTSLRVVP